jgi:hypothetical protein
LNSFSLSPRENPDWLKFKNPEAPAVKREAERIGGGDYPATVLMCGETEWSK